MKQTIAMVLLLVFCLAAALSAMGCRVQEYKVDYDGAKELYEGAKDTYPVRSEVELYFPYIASDTDYAFYLDGEPLDFDYDAEKGFIIRFVMPPHDVKLTCETENSMYYALEAEEYVMLFDYYRATTAAEGDGHYELLLESGDDPDVLRLCEYVKEDGAEETCTVYLVPGELFDLCKDIAKKYDMQGWEELEDGISLDGVKLVCKYYDGAKWVRAASDCMPENGTAAFDEIAELLGRYTTEDYRE